MVVILSSEDDQSTNDVIDWLNFYGKDFIRINPSDTIADIQINTSLGFRFSVNGIIVDIANVSSFWYRRGTIKIETYQIQDDIFPFSNALNKHLKIENNPINEFILNSLNQKNGLGDYYNTDANKFGVLLKAKDVGLSIPPTLVTTKKVELREFIIHEGQAITKTMGAMIMAYENGNSLTSYTKRITLEHLHDLGETFSPSLFQKEISKQYELRIFYLDGEFFSMAIFSQEDKQTAIDFRVYNHVKPNRTVPFELPKTIKEKLRKLMVNCNYSTGSIDMIYTIDKEFVFLEINPIGQYDMVSVPCNYYLNKRIAERLSSTYGAA
jgi:ATP-GRASP peptide maturase of grasp-with-spasm system